MKLPEKIKGKVRLKKYLVFWRISHYKINKIEVDKNVKKKIRFATTKRISIGSIYEGKGGEIKLLSEELSLRRML